MDEKKTKIICTIADNRCDVDFIRQLYENGMNVVRINSAHASIEGAQMVVDNVRKVSDRIAIPRCRMSIMPLSTAGSAGGIIGI